MDVSKSGSPVAAKTLPSIRGLRWKVADLARLHPRQLAPPASNVEKLDWIDVRGVPDYDDVAVPEQRLKDGRIILRHARRDRVVDRLEIQNVYGAVFEASSSADKRSVLRRYTANFPHLAFDPDSWLWPFWQQWRSGNSKSDKQNLDALAAGIRARAWGWMSKKRFQARRLSGARDAFRRLTSDSTLQALYANHRDSLRIPDAEQRAEHERHGRQLLAQIRTRTGYVSSLAELHKYKLSGLLLRAVAKQFKVRERDLH